MTHLNSVARQFTTAALLAAAGTFFTSTLRAQQDQPQPAKEPAAVTDEQIQQWIKQLGDEDFQTREAAQKSLVAAGNPAYFALEALPASDDAEVKSRVERTLRALEDDAVGTLRALGATIVKAQGAENWNRFYVENPDATDEDFAPLARLRHLEYISFEATPVTDRVLEYFRPAKKLQRISIYGADITDAGVQQLAEIRSLQAVLLLLPKMTNEGFAELTKLPRLTTLSIFDSPINGKGLEHLAPLRHQLVALGLQGTEVADDDLVHLRGFSVLRSLRLNETRVKGDGLVHVVELPQLESLLLYRLALNDAAFAHIAKMPKLQSVSLNDSGVTRDNLLALRESRSLVRIRVSPDEFTEEEVEEIQREFDQREIELRTKIKR